MDGGGLDDRALGISQLSILVGWIFGGSMDFSLMFENVSL